MRFLRYPFLFVLLSSPLFLHAQINWTRDANNPVLHASTANQYDVTKIDWAFRSSVIYDEDRSAYLAWLCAWVTGTFPYDYSVSHAASFDGAHWFYYSKNPVIERSPNDFSSRQIDQVEVVKAPGGYKMYYTANDAPWSDKIGLATSPDGIQWEKYEANPVLSPGSPGTWDSQNILATSVIVVGTSYFMWYSGAGPDLIHRVGLATSPDGIVWTKHPDNPVLDLGSPGQWDDFALGEPTVTLVNGVFYMMYAGSSGSGERIGLATSPNGIVWERYGSNPVFSSQESWEGSRMGPSSLVFKDNKFHLWYSAYNQGWQTGYAIADSEDVVTAVVQHGDETPEAYQLSQNYPNPFNPGTTITYALPVDAQVTLDVYDILGRSVAQLIDGPIEAGYHELAFDVSKLSSGLYFYRLTAVGSDGVPFTRTEKMLLTK